ncbi:MAG: redoxin domain-containing protein [Saprospiraceae bacterium]
MRFSLFIVLACLLGACNSKKKLTSSKPTSGVVRYAIQLDLNDNAGGMEESFGKSALATFNQNYLHFKKDQQENYGNFQIVNLATGEEINYLTVKEKKFGIKTPQEAIPSIGAFSFLNEYKTIAGYRCQKATAPMGDGTMTVYFTKEIGVNFCPYVDFDGFALEYTLAMPYGMVNYAATFVNLKTIAAATVTPPNDYKIITAQELENEIIGDSKPTGTQAKHFSRQDLAGNTISLPDLKGKVVVINFWFTQCPPCKIEIPDLNRLKANYSAAAVEFLAISFDTADEIQRFLEKTPFDFKIIPNAREIIKDYDIFVYPTTLVIDQSGYVLDTKMGGSTKIMAELKTVIDQALSTKTN